MTREARQPTSSVAARPPTRSRRSDIEDRELIEFLQWALPRLRKRWPGFEKPRGQVKKRLRDRLRWLGIETLDAYRGRLEADPGEWAQLDFISRITISRFYRNERAWKFLREVVLPELAKAATAQNRSTLRAWSAGCASGEEPYTLRILFDLELSSLGLDLEISASDLDPQMIERAKTARYPASSVRRLPEAWRRAAFDLEGEMAVLRPSFRRVAFDVADITQRTPPGPFDLVFCSYAVFIYYETEVAASFVERLAPESARGAGLVVGSHEAPPPGVMGHLLEPWDEHGDVFRFVGSRADRPRSRGSGFGRA